MILNWIEAMPRIVRADVDRRTIDVGEWLSSVPVWYRAAASGIVRHLARMLAMPIVRAGDPAEWIADIRRSVKLLSPPDGDPEQARGVIEWRNPDDPPAAEPLYGVLWATPGDLLLRWTDLGNLECLGGYHVTQDASGMTPLGGAAEGILARAAQTAARVTAETGDHRP